MCIKTVENYPHVLEFFSECSKTQKMCNKLPVRTLLQQNLFLNHLWLKKYVMKQLIDVFFVFSSIPDQHKTQEMSDSIVSEDLFW